MTGILETIEEMGRYPIYVGLEGNKVGTWYVATHLAGETRLLYTDGPDLLYHVRGDLLLFLLYLTSVWL